VCMAALALPDLSSTALRGMGGTEWGLQFPPSLLCAERGLVASPYPGGVSSAVPVRWHGSRAMLAVGWSAPSQRPWSCRTSSSTPIRASRPVGRVGQPSRTRRAAPLRPSRPPRVRPGPTRPTGGPLADARPLWSAGRHRRRSVAGWSAGPAVAAVCRRQTG